MEKLNLLFTKDGLQYQITRNKTVLEENAFFQNEDAPSDFILQKLKEVLGKKFFSISVYSALNHFTLMPEGFSQHDLGYDLINYNAQVNPDEEELMLSVNKRLGVQFYYTLPKEYYQLIKGVKVPTHFNFSGEKFLSSIHPKGGNEIHINLYHHQCEFVALKDKKVLLYNNLDVDSEVDFLYFIMFTLSKIGFGTQDAYFFVYGETSENETFISELRKFVNHLKIVFDNIPKQNFILKIN